MAELLKNLFNRETVGSFALQVAKVYPNFNQAAYLHEIFNHNWELLELKKRMRKLTKSLRNHLTGDYPKDLEILLELIQQQKSVNQGMSFTYMVIPDYIEQFGIDHYRMSLQAMEAVTTIASCEFAIRPFLIKYLEDTMNQMQQWSRHKDERVRRFASEGCRPRLPWAMAVPRLKKDPSLIIPVLGALKDDPSEFVRRSVANNLNDISKDHPELFVELLHKWFGHSAQRDKLLKHAARTLLKKSEPRVMQLFGFGNNADLAIEQFKLHTKEVKIGENLTFSFILINHSPNGLLIRMEYAIYYLLKNGAHSRKVFKISEKTYAGNSKTLIERSHSFRPITTRTYYTGKHAVSMIGNGKESNKLEFKLI